MASRHDDRTKAAETMARTHLQWKIQAHKRYKEECRVYVKRRIQWEIHLVKEAIKVPDILWPIEMSHNDRLSSMRNLEIPEDCRAMVEVEQTNE
jgi:hypothetical protein